MNSVRLQVLGCAIVAAAMASAAAQAQMLPAFGDGIMRQEQVSDFGGPYAAMPPEPDAPDAVDVLPSRVIYDVLREAGYLPLGMPRPRGPVYTIAVISPNDEDGRLVIDARSGRILRFVPADRVGRVIDERTVAVPRRSRALAPMRGWGAPPRPPASIPRVARQPPAAPLPRATPPRAVEPEAPVAEKPAAAPQQQQAIAARPAPAAIPAAAPPAPLLPTQQMPAAQGLE